MTTDVNFSPESPFFLIEGHERQNDIPPNPGSGAARAESPIDPQRAADGKCTEGPRNAAPASHKEMTGSSSYSVKRTGASSWWFTILSLDDGSMNIDWQDEFLRLRAEFFAGLQGGYR